jgi:hypothetical protein
MDQSLYESLFDSENESSLQDNKENYNMEFTITSSINEGQTYRSMFDSFIYKPVNIKYLNINIPLLYWNCMIIGIVLFLSSYMDIAIIYSIYRIFKLYIYIAILYGILISTLIKIIVHIISTKYLISKIFGPSKLS